MKEYTFKFRHVVEVEVKVTRSTKLDAEDRAQEVMEIYGEGFLADDDADFHGVGSEIWLGGEENKTCAKTIKRDGWELVSA